MVMQYNKRLEEARLELAEIIRRRIAQAIGENCPYLSIVSGSAGFYRITDGRLYTQVSTGFRSSVDKEITPAELPLERYDVSTLLDIARKVKAE